MSDTWRPAPVPEGMTRDPNPPFPNHRTYPVSVDTLDGIETVAMAIRELHDAMTKLPSIYRVLSVTMMSDEVAEILKMIQVDQAEYDTRPHDLPPVTITPVEGPSAA
jgi:hypothetical protein